MIFQIILFEFILFIFSFPATSAKEKLRNISTSQTQGPSNNSNVAAPPSGYLQFLPSFLLETTIEDDIDAYDKTGLALKLNEKVFVTTNGISSTLPNAHRRFFSFMYFDQMISQLRRNPNVAKAERRVKARWDRKREREKRAEREGGECGGLWCG